MKNDNIVAISTALGASGVAVIRISGDSPLEIAKKMFFPLEKISVDNFVPNKMYVGEIKTEKFSDLVWLCILRGQRVSQAKILWNFTRTVA